MPELHRDRKENSFYSHFQPEAFALEALRHLPYGMLITDEQDCIEYANEAAAQLIGTGIDKLIGRKSADILSPSYGSGDAKPRALSTSGADIAPAGSPLKHTTTSISMDDGRGARIATMHLLEADAGCEPLEEALKRSENRYRRLFEGSKDMIFIHTRGGIFKDMNQACVETLGYDSKEELLSLASVERIYINPMHRRVFQEQIDTFGFVKDFECSFRKRDGACLYCLVNGNAVRDADGKIVGYEAIAKDITARMDSVLNLHQQNRELSLLHSVAVTMNETQNLDEILAMALKKVLEVLNLTAGAIFLINQKKSAFELKVHRGLSEAIEGGAYSLTLHDQALMQSLLEENRSLKPQRTFPPFKASLRAPGKQDGAELLCFLITAKDRASGFLALRLSAEINLSYRDCQMLGSLGNFLGSAVDNAFLAQTIRRHREELKGLTARLFSSQEEERKRIARELHDETGQALTGISFALDMISRSLRTEGPAIEEQLLDIRKQISRTYQEIRRISHRLHPAVLSDLGLEPALESCLAHIAKYAQLDIDFKMVGFEERMDPQIETILYRISQEAVNNTVKHAHAKHFKLSIVKSYPDIIFTAEDDGVGFDPERPEQNGKALGLLGMRERATLANGKFLLRSEKGKGVRIRIEIPTRERSDE